MIKKRAESYYKRLGTEPLLESTIPERFQMITAQYADCEAVVSVHQGRRLTYADMQDAVRIVSRGLLGLGFCTGDRIGIWSTNNLEWLLLQMATAEIGVILVNINPAYRLRELAYALQRSEVHGLFVIPSFHTSDYVSMLVKLIPALKEQGAAISNADFPVLRKIILYYPENPEKTSKPHPGFLLWQDLIRSAERISEQNLADQTKKLDPYEAINIQYTSGTTGFPKAVVLSHHNILNNAYFTAQAMNFGEGDRLCVSVPFYHCFGMVLANLLCLATGGCLVIPCEYFDAGQVLEAIHTEHCTAVHGVPTMFIAELEHSDFNTFDLSSLRTGIMAGAPCPPSLMSDVMEKMHCHEILIGYGQTEASPITHLTAIDDSFERRTETVGRNLPHQEVRICDPLDGTSTVAFGNVGEICFRGYHIMKGYYGDEEATQKAIDQDGWLHSGDLGIMDEDGYVQVTGRLKEMIIRGGENIYPREIEDFLFTHPKVATAAVFGIPDKFYGEEVVAWIQLHSGEVCSEDQIKSYCKDAIAHFKIPKHIMFVEKFPMTVTGKIQKFRMREITVKGLQERQG